MFERLKTLFVRPSNGPVETAPRPDGVQAAKLKSEGEERLAAGDLNGAVSSLEAAAQAGPGDPGVLVPLGYALWRLGRHSRASDCLRKALAIDARSVDAHYLLALSLRDDGQGRQAIEHFAAALSLEPNLVEAYPPLIDACVRSGDPAAGKKAADRGLEACRSVLDGDPSNAYALNVAGLLWREREVPELALASFDKALVARPDFAEAIANRGNVLFDLRRFEEALAAQDRALRLEPLMASAHAYRGNVLRELVRHEEALASYDRALALNPRLPDVGMNKGLSHLVLGDLVLGWQGYEGRWAVRHLAHPREMFSAPLWLGTESLRDKTILIHAEQGLGDTIQFCRYIELLRNRGARVLLGIQPPLVPLLANMPGVDEIVVPGALLPAFDFHCPLLSLPLAFGTTLATIPNPGPYIRLDDEASTARVDAWRALLGPRERARVGLVWSGSVIHKNDVNRSIPLADFGTILGCDAEFICLQNELRADDAAVLAQRPDIAYFGPRLLDFAETAALIEHLDLVISVDTSVAHVGGAMGKPVWLLVPLNPDWRWLLDRGDSPWYETVRLFRQTRLGDWSETLATVGGELKLFVKRIRTDADPGVSG